MKLRHLSIGLLAAACILAPAIAADEFTDGMQAACMPHREALLRAHGKDVAQAAVAIEQAQRAWQSLAEQFAARPPASYGRDAQFAATLAQVAYPAAQLRAEAPAAWQQDAEFAAHLRSLDASVAAVREALVKLKAPYSRMFLKYG